MVPKKWDDPPMHFEGSNTEAGGVLTMLLSFSVWHHSEVWHAVVVCHWVLCLYRWRQGVEKVARVMLGSDKIIAPQANLGGTNNWYMYRWIVINVSLYVMDYL